MAGLIPQSFIDDLLNRTDIVDVVSSRIQLKKTGKNYSACCPFHKEKTPSFSVSPDKQFYYCFGCGAGGNALGFIMDHDNLDFPQAVEELAKADTTATCFMNLANVDDAFVEEAGITTSRTCTFSGVPAAPQLPYAGDYVAAYRAEFGVDPDVWGAFTYDSAWVLFHAMAEAGTTKYGPVLDAVLHTRGLQGATGTIDIRSNSGNRKDAPMYILKVNRKGDFVIVE